MRALLKATCAIEAGAEIFFKYGSQTPFEHIRREQQFQQQQRMMRRRDVIKWVWVPHAAADAV